MPRLFVAACLAVLVATPALADFETRRSGDDVATVMDRLETAVRDAGATIFARVDHAEGAAGVEMELRPAQLLIFGNPRLGTPAMQEEIRAGLMLPLRVLVYEDGGETVIFWQEPAAMLEELGIDGNADYLDRMDEALENLTAAAAG